MCTGNTGGKNGKAPEDNACVLIKSLEHYLNSKHEPTKDIKIKRTRLQMTARLCSNCSCYHSEMKVEGVRVQMSVNTHSSMYIKYKKKCNIACQGP